MIRRTDEGSAMGVYLLVDSVGQTIGPVLFGGAVSFGNREGIGFTAEKKCLAQRVSALTKGRVVYSLDMIYTDAALRQRGLQSQLVRRIEPMLKKMGVYYLLAEQWVKVGSPCSAANRQKFKTGYGSTDLSQLCPKRRIRVHDGGSNRNFGGFNH